MDDAEFKRQHARMVLVRDDVYRIESFFSISDDKTNGKWRQRQFFMLIFFVLISVCFKLRMIVSYIQPLFQLRTLAFST